MWLYFGEQFRNFRLEFRFLIIFSSRLLIFMYFPRKSWKYPNLGKNGGYFSPNVNHIHRPFHHGLRFQPVQTISLIASKSLNLPNFSTLNLFQDFFIWSWNFSEGYDWADEKQGWMVVRTEPRDFRDSYLISTLINVFDYFE